MLKILEKQELEVLDNPLTIEEMKSQMISNNKVKGIVAISVSDMIDNDLEGFLDILSETLVGNPCLMDINYNLVATKDGIIYIEVIGDASEIIRMDSDSNETYYYNVSIFYDRKNSFNRPIKTFEEIFDADDMCNYVVNYNLMSSEDALQIDFIEEISKEEFLEMGGKE